ncbi:CDP-glycerol:poly(glycerophosphate) glycerophosphotransferase, putative [Babesia ovata]|uniref:CDP-glycerol:poly(Glycerophosphate) glycerophosphotransferase, putative n=1 Tax=Babesia ovata TaxID=189622 RepID=A0A2H6KE05_9APIC|nr:CDP-glycerol:poly(glycerophosphate) glycerophosphotransferase, putative [Babesia ovata]GBE61230.1 CDP-glycerol:poly(glycerophosphate) glycerophosphotransferase, putative [Babesia ovata]
MTPQRCSFLLMMTLESLEEQYGLSFSIEVPELRIRLMQVDEFSWSKVHQHVLRQEAVSARELADTQQGVLHDTHDRTVTLRGDNLLRHKHEVFYLRTRFVRLGEMEVHFVSIEIRIVRRGYRQVQTERRVRQDLATVSHDTHLVKRRLPIKQDEVTILQMPLYAVTVLQLQVARPLHVAQVKARPIVTNDELGAWPLVRTHFNLGSQTLKVERSHGLTERKCHGDGLRHADDVDGKVGVTRDDSTRREVHTLSHKVATQPSVLTLQARSDGLDGLL